MAAIALGMMVSGCNKNKDNNASFDKNLNGVWGWNDTFVYNFDNGKYEFFLFGVLVKEGTYTTNDGIISFQASHTINSLYDNMIFEGMNYTYNDKKMYTKKEYEKLVREWGKKQKENLTENDYATLVNLEFDTASTNYSVDVDKKEFYIDGVTHTKIK